MLFRFIFKGLWSNNWCGSNNRYEDANAKPILFNDKGVLTENFGEALPEDFRKDSKAIESLGKFKGKAAADIMKSYVEIERRAGNSVQIPGENATEEERAKFYTKMGRPETPDGYKITVPEGVQISDEEGFKAFKQKAHKAGWSNKRLQEAIDMYADNIKATAAKEAATQQTQNAAKAEKLATARRLLESKWGQGEAFERNAQYADKAASEIMGKDYIDQLTEAGLNDNPIVLEAHARMGKRVGIKPIVAGKAAGADADPRQRMKNFYGDTMKGMEQKE